MKADWSELEEHRKCPAGHEMYHSKAGDKFGWFVWFKGKTQLRVMAADGTVTGWEHVSVTVAYKVGKNWKKRLPTWEEMCWVKAMFFEADECVVQYHPPEKDYVNLMHNCLHLWRSVAAEFPVPPTFMV